MVRPGRFERPTHSLEGCCSIHLSYGRISHMKKEPEAGAFYMTPLGKSKGFSAPRAAKTLARSCV